MSAIQQMQIKNPTRSLIMANKASGTATTTGNIMAYVSGLAVDATSSEGPEDLVGLCNQTITAGEALTQVPVIEFFAGDTFLADSTNNSNVLHNGQRMIIGANAHTINNTGTTSAVGVVEQVDVYGAAADKKILVKFVVN